MAVPIFERITKKYSPAIITTAAPMTSTSTHWMLRNGMGTRSSRKSICRVGVDAGAEEAPERVLEHERRPNGGDQRHEPRGIPEGPVRDPLDEERESGSNHGGDRAHDGDRQQRGQRAGVQDAGIGQANGGEVAGEHPGHEDLAVGEVDHAQDAVDHGVAEGDERIDTAERGARDGEVDPRLGW